MSNAHKIIDNMALAWDESQHPRDNKGQFGDSAGFISKSASPFARQQWAMKVLAEKEASGKKFGNTILPVATKDQAEKAESLNSDDKARPKITKEMIDPTKVVTIQNSINIDRVRSMLDKVHEFMRPSKEMPVVHQVGDKLVVLDGNHRITASLLMGKPILAEVWRK